MGDNGESLTLHFIYNGRKILIKWFTIYILLFLSQFLIKRSLDLFIYIAL